MKIKFLSDFKAFAMKGNVMDMAVGVIIGGAFGKIVTSLVNDIIMPIMGILIGGINFKDLKWVIKEASADGTVPEVILPYGNFIQNTVDFLIIAFSIFTFISLIQKLSNHHKKEEESKKAADPAPAPKVDPKEALLTEIRDLLKEQKNK